MSAAQTANQNRDLDINTNIFLSGSNEISPPIGHQRSHPKLGSFNVSVSCREQAVTNQTYFQKSFNPLVWGFVVSCRRKSQASDIWNFFYKGTFSREELLQAGRSLIFIVCKGSVKSNTDI